MANREKNTKKSKKWLIYLILGGFLLEIFKILFKNKDKIKKFSKEEEMELKELCTHEQGWGKFYCDSRKIFKDLFIPHEDNGHKPKFLRPKSLTTIVVFLLLLKVSVVGVLFLTHPQGAQVSEAIVQRVLELTNIDRANENLGKLAMHPILNSSALQKANDMIAQNYFNHYSPDGKKPWDFINRETYRYIYVGENLGMNFTTAESVHKALMASPTHRKNIMNERYSDIGLAMVSGMINGKETNVLVQFFGSESAALAVAPAPATTPEVKPTPPTPVEVAGESSFAEATEDKASITESIKEEMQPEPKEEPIEELQEAPSYAEASDGRPIEIPKEEIIVKKDTAEAMTAQTEEEKIARLPALPDVEITLPVISSNIAAQTPIVRVENTASPNLAMISRALKIINYFFAGVMALLLLALLVNIVVRLEVQHKPVIVQTLLVILLVSSFWYFKLHYLEAGIAEILLL